MEQRIKIHYSQVWNAVIGTALNDDIRLEGLRCNVEGAEPIDLTLTGKSVQAPDTNDVLEFSCPVRCPNIQSKDVTLQNPTDVSWSLKPSISHEAWHGAEMLNIPAGSSASYTLQYKPLKWRAAQSWICNQRCGRKR